LFNHLYAILHVHFLATSDARMTPDDLFSTNQLLAQQSGNDCFRHHTAANKREAAVA
jgi:hypothetical protein